MATIRQQSFAGGEISSELSGRSDVAKHATALRLCRNFIPTPFGPVQNRPGSMFIAHQKTHTRRARLVPFHYALGQNFVLEFGHTYIRFIKAGVYVPGPLGGAPYEVTHTYIEGELRELQFSQCGDVLVICHPNHEPAELRRIADDEWTLTDIDFDPPGPYFYNTETEGLPKLQAGACREVYPWAAGNGKVWMEGDFCTHKNRLWRCLYNLISSEGTLVLPIDDDEPKDGSSRWVEDSMELAVAWQWRLTTVCEDANGKRWETSPYSVAKVRVGGYGLWDKWKTYGVGDSASSTELLPSDRYISIADPNTGHALDNPAWWNSPSTSTRETERSVPGLFVVNAANPAKLRWPKPTYIPDPGFLVVGWRVYRGTAGVFGLVGEAIGRTAEEFVDYGQAPNYAIQPPAGRNPFDVLKNDGTTNYTENPAVPAHFEQRRVFANCYDPSEDRGRPGVIIASRTGDLGNFDKHELITLPDDSLELNLAATRYEEIRALVPLRKLLVFTNQGIWTFGGAGGTPLSALSIDGRIHVSHGAAWLPPLPTGNSVIWLQEAGQRVRDLLYSQEAESFKSVDLSTWARHLLLGRKAVEWAWADEPFGILWVVRDDGALLSCTYEPEQDVVAWAQHDLGGVVESVAAIPEEVVIDHGITGIEGGTPSTTVVETGIYLIVRRLIGDSELRHVERLATRRVTEARAGVFVDSAAGYDGRNTDTSHVVTIPAAQNAGDTDELVATGWKVDTHVPAVVAGDHIIIGPNSDSPARFRVDTVVDDKTLRGTLLDNLPMQYQNVATSEWGLAVQTMTVAHLPRMGVATLQDGVPLSGETGDGGVIDFAAPRLIVRVGMAFNADLELLDLAVGAGAGGRSNVKTVHRVDFEVTSSGVGIYVGEDFSHLVAAAQQAVDAQGFSAGVIPVRIRNSWNRGGRACVRQSAALPLTVLAMTREVEFGGS